jgi:hypothetical protein
MRKLTSQKQRGTVVAEDRKGRDREARERLDDRSQTPFHRKKAS